MEPWRRYVCACACVCTQIGKSKSTHKEDGMYEGYFLGPTQVTNHTSLYINSGVALLTAAAAATGSGLTKKPLSAPLLAPLPSQFHINAHKGLCCGSYIPAGSLRAAAPPFILSLSLPLFLLSMIYQKKHIIHSSFCCMIVVSCLTISFAAYFAAHTACVG